MKRGVKYLVTIILSGALLLFSTLPAYASVTNNANGVNVQQIIMLSCLDGSHDLEATEYDLSTPGLEYASGFSTTNRYDYLERMVLRISFGDSSPHTGYITYTNSDSGRALTTDDPNVALTNTRIYFYDSVGFEVYVPSYWVNQTSVATHPTYTTITLNSYVPATDVHTVNDIYSLISTTQSTNASYLESIYNRLGSGNASVYTLLTDVYSEQIDQGLSLDQMNTYLNHIELAINNMYSELLDQGLTLDDIAVDTNAILSYIKSYRQFNIPVESFGINWNLFYYLNDISLRNNLFWDQYPMFEALSGDRVLQVPVYYYRPTTIILGVTYNVYDDTTLNTLFTSSNAGDTLTFVRNIDRGNPIIRFIEFNISAEQSHNSYLSVNSDVNIIGIYMQSASTLGMSTEFTEIWFPNDSIADEIDDASDELSDVTDDFSEASDELHDMDIDALEDMDGKLEDIDLSTSITTSTNFLSTASWVRERFNFLTQNNFSVFGEIITFSLTIGLVLVLLGKLRS